MADSQAAGTLPLAGRVALVTGSSRGIGRATALRLAQMGADVAVNYRSDEAGARAAVAEIEALGRRPSLYRPMSAKKRMSPAWVRNSVGDWPDHYPRQQRWHDQRSVAAAHERRAVRPGHRDEPAFRFPLLEDGAALDDEGALGTRRQCLIHLWANGTDGTGELRGLQGRADRADQVHRTRGRQSQHHRQRCGAWLRAHRTYLNPHRGVARLLSKADTAGPFGTAEEVAATIAFLCSPEAGFITGQTIAIDGGISMM